MRTLSPWELKKERARWRGQHGKEFWVEIEEEAGTGSVRA